MRPQLLAARLVRVALDRDVVEEPAELDAVVAPTPPAPAGPDRASPAAGRTRRPCTRCLDRSSLPSPCRVLSCRWVVELLHVEAAVDVHVGAVARTRAASDASQTTTAAPPRPRSHAPERCVPDGTLPHLGGPGGVMRLSMIPGLTQLTRIPWCPANLATDFVRPITPALEAAYDGTGGEPSGLPGERRDRHDAPPTARNHRSKRRLAGEERAAKVDRLDPVPLVGRYLVEGRRVEDARAGHEDIDRPELLPRRSRRPGRRRRRP